MTCPRKSEKSPGNCNPHMGGRARMYRLIEVGTDSQRGRFCDLGGPVAPGPDTLLLLEGPSGPLARCALWWTDTADLAGQRIGAIGHYFAASTAAGAELLRLACTRLAGQGCGLAVGPL